MLKKGKLLLSVLTAALLLTSCGKSGSDDVADVNLIGPLSDIMGTLYENAELSQDFKESMENDFDSGEIPAESAEYLIGTADVEYEEGYYSMPLMNVVPYQCILLRLPEGADVEAAKQTISDHADPRKWVCVEAESVVVENVGNVILFVMGDTETTNALRSAFLELGE